MPSIEGVGCWRCAGFFCRTVHLSLVTSPVEAVTGADVDVGFRNVQ